MPGSSWTLRARRPAQTMATASTIVPPTFQLRFGCSLGWNPAGRAAAVPNDGSSISSADSADTMMMTCSVCELPIHGIRTKLVTIEPTMAPTVFAA